MKKLRTYLSQVNNIFGDQAFLPYSVGLLQAYVEAQPDLRDRVEFGPLMFERVPVSEVAGSLVAPDVLGLSCYVWNWEYSLALARAVKAIFSDCLIVLGGPHVPLKSEDFFVAHPYVDLLVHHEGEHAFAEILSERLTGQPDYRHIDGLSIRLSDFSCVRTNPRSRNDHLDSIPSPYLTGVFAELMKLPYRWNASHETNRGCPYSCTFCDWGSAVFTRLRQFDTARLVGELQWFGNNAIEVLYNCDANLGILARDLELTRTLAAVKTETGYPQQFRPSFAKKSNDTVFEIAKVLHEVGLQRGITLSMQSMDDRPLKAIRRRNIKVDNLIDRLSLYRAHRMPTYTELILGLPGETYVSFADGVDELLKAGQHEGLLVYLCEVLPNAEMGDIGYREAHGIRTIRMPIMLGYATPSADDITEFFDVVVQTNSMPHAEWRRAFMFSWAIQVFHCLNLARALSVFLWCEHGIGYRSFYEALLEFCERNPNSVLGGEYRRTWDKLGRAVAGEELGEVIPKFGNVMWNPEEASFLNLVDDKESTFREIYRFFSEIASSRELDVPDRLRDDIVRYQADSLVGPGEPRVLSISTSYNIGEYVHGALHGRPVELVHGEFVQELSAVIELSGAYVDYAMKGVRYGRKNNHLRRVHER